MLFEIVLHMFDLNYYRTIHSSQRMDLPPQSVPQSTIFIVHINLLIARSEETVAPVYAFGVSA